VGSELLVDDARVLVERNRSRSKRMRSISRFLVSENCVAMTTRHRLIMKKEPICGKTEEQSEWNHLVFTL
jgi:hypothetical protein